MRYQYSFRSPGAGMYGCGVLQPSLEGFSIRLPFDLLSNYDGKTMLSTPNTNPKSTAFSSTTESLYRLLDERHGLQQETTFRHENPKSMYLHVSGPPEILSFCFHILYMKIVYVKTSCIINCMFAYWCAFHDRQSYFSYCLSYHCRRSLLYQWPSLGLCYWLT